MPKKMYKSITLGKNIKNIRRNMKYTQEQFAEKIEISSQFLSQTERGVAGISLDTAIKICNTANCSPALLFKDIIKTTSTFDNYTLLTDTNKTIVDQLIKVLLDNQI